MLTKNTKTRLSAIIGTGALIAGGGFAALAFTGGTALAAQSGSDPTINGTANLTAGSLSVQAPGSVAWSTTITGLDEVVAGTLSGPFQVTDATGSGAGWSLNVQADAFTGSAGSLAGSDALTFNGGATPTDTTAMDVAAVTGSTAVLPTDADVTYPVSISTTAPSPTAIYDAPASTGLGSFNVGTSNPGTFWLPISGDALAGSYTSTITVSLSSGPA
jgi:WxL domain surface cell wall-binding